MSAVPTGHCDYDGEVCLMQAIRLMCLGNQGDLYNVECRCADGSWACVGEWSSGSVCDYAVDGGTDG
jgi:hypothetical protein